MPCRTVAGDVEGLAEETDWVRLMGGYAFVKVRGKSSGTDLLFARDGKGKWSLACVLSRWVS